MMHTYKNLLVWKKSLQLVKAVYQLTEHYPKEEVYGLTSQMRRASVSIASNIAEGRMLLSTGNFIRFLLYSYGSGGELETQITISKELRKTQHLDYIKVDKLLDEVMKMLNSLISQQKKIRYGKNS